MNITQEEYLNERTPIVEQCKGLLDDKPVNCEHIIEDEGVEYCTSYLFPDKKHRLCSCNFATHIKSIEDQKNKVKKRVGQQKQKKSRRK